MARGWAIDFRHCTGLTVVDGRVQIGWIRADIAPGLAAHNLADGHRPCRSSIGLAAAAAYHSEYSDANGDNGI